MTGGYMQGRVMQGGQMVASVSGRINDVWRELRHYGRVYEQDGPVTLEMRGEDERRYTEWKDWRE